MNADRRETARIFQFPVRPLAAERRAAAERSFALDQRVPRAPMADFGSGWYHDAAIRSEEAPPRVG